MVDMTERKNLPYYQDVDGFRIPGAFSADIYRSGLKYKPRPNDLFIVTFPKCGTTWTQQITSLIYNKGVSVRNHVEFSQRTSFLELLGIEGPESMIRPGTIKVHLPYHLTPKSDQAKYLCVVRNPKDTLVSFYHHTCQPLYRFEGDFNDYFKLFINGETDFGDYFDHVLSWYEHRNDPNVMFLTYEELKRDNVKSINKIAKFMGEEYLNELENNADVLNNVIKRSSVDFMKGVFNDTFESISESVKASGADHSSLPAGLRHIIEQMDKNVPEKPFELVRKGIIGDWRNNLTKDQAEQMDNKIETKLKGTYLYTYWKSIACI